jgi:hypothetical protein
MNVETPDRRSRSKADALAIAELVVCIWPKPGRTVEAMSAKIVGPWKDHSGPERQHPRSFEASYWKDGLGLGLMNPMLWFGELTGDIAQ